MVNRTLSIWNELRPFSVGFDDIFAHFNHTLEHTANQTQSYPHYNINKIDDLNWSIEVALAGFDKKDIEVSYSDNCLTIKSIFDKDENELIMIRMISRAEVVGSGCSNSRSRSCGEKRRRRRW